MTDLARHYSRFRVADRILLTGAEIVPNLGTLAGACARHGTTLLIDAYHHLNVVPFDVHAMGLGSAFITGGGYKYCQLGEGNCFLRTPPDTRLRPVITGWFSEFAELTTSRLGDTVPYGEGAARFAGATYDPTSHYRAAAVFAFHEEMRACCATSAATRLVCCWADARGDVLRLGPAPYLRDQQLRDGIAALRECV